jgi:hypothetical protein
MLNRIKMKRKRFEEKKASKPGSRVEAFVTGEIVKVRTEGIELGKGPGIAIGHIPDHRVTPGNKTLMPVPGVHEAKVLK